MHLLKLPLAYLLLISVVAAPVSGQHKRRVPEKSPAKTQAAPAPSPSPTPTPEPAPPVTFETLLSANSYKVYAEARGVGQLVRSSAATDVLEPILKLGGPSGAFVEGVEWLKAHADQLMTSRMMLAAWPTADVPDALIAIEFSSTEEATKFETKLNGILAKVVPPVVTPEDSPPSAKKTDPQQPATAKTAPESVPGYYLQRADSLILVSPKPVQLKKLRPKDSKLLAEDPSFRTAYNRFSSEPIFVYVDINSIQKETEERTKKAQEEWKKQQEAQKEAEEKQKAEDEKNGVADQPELTEAEKAAAGMEITPEPSPEPSPEVPTELVAKEPTDAEVLSNALSGLQMSLFNGAPDLPDALGIGFSPDNDSFDVRVLMIDNGGERSDPIPFFPGLTLGGPVAPDSPGVLPGDTELVIMMSLDFAQIHARMSSVEPPSDVVVASSSDSANTMKPKMWQSPEFAAPLRTIERITKINLKDELLPLLGSEVAVSMPMTGFGLFGLPSSPPPPAAEPKDAAKSEEAAKPRTPFIVMSLRDREGMRRLMPRILEGFAGKAAAALSQSERREDTELVSIGNLFAYAFVGNFLVLGMDAATTRYVVDSYLKGETLGANVYFKNYTRWQPRQVQAQAYMSEALSANYKEWVNSPSAHIGDEARAFFNRVNTDPQPITYSLSNDGLGALHELHVPKNLVIASIATMASVGNPPETVKNERQAMGMMWSFASAQRKFKEEQKRSYGSLDELMAASGMTKEGLDATGYKFEIRLVADGFEVSAVPIEYGKTGKLSFFMNQESTSIHGADHAGAPASASDPEVSY